MGTTTHTYSSEYLPVERLRECLMALPRVLHKLLGDGELTAMYGVGANLHIDLCYQPMKVETTWLEQFIENTLEHKIVVPGQSDLIFSTPGETLHIVICHEGDIHVNGSDDELMRRFMQSPPFSEVQFGSREETR